MKDDINSSYLVTLSLKFQWHTKVNEDTFCGDSSSNNFMVGKSSLQEMANFGDYPGDFRL